MWASRRDVRDVFVVVLLPQTFDSGIEGHEKKSLRWPSWWCRGRRGCECQCLAGRPSRGHFSLGPKKRRNVK